MHGKIRNAPRRAVTAGLLVFYSALPAATAQVTIHPMLTTGIQAPGAPAGSHFSYFSFPVINNFGQVAFEAGLSTGGYGYWTNSTGSVELVARRGSTVLSVPGATFSNLLGPLLADNGEVSFTGLWSHPTPPTLRHGVFRGRPGGVSALAKTYDVAPGLAPGSFFQVVSTDPVYGNTISSPTINAAGSTAFYAKAYDTDFGYERIGLWTDSAGTLEPIALQWMDAPRLTNTWFESFGSSYGEEPTPVINDHGAIAFRSRLGSTTDPSYGSLWSYQQGAMNLVARAGEQAPGLASGVQYLDFSNPFINNQSRIAFAANLTGPSVSPSNDVAVFSQAGGAIHLVARKGEALPGLEAGVTALGFDPRTRISGADITLIHAALSGPGIHSANDTGLWWERENQLSLLAREGAHAPGTDPGVIFATGDMGFGGSLAMNALGQVVFSSSLSGPGVTATNNQGFWGTDTDGQLHLIVRKGQTIEIAPGDLRTISGFITLSYFGTGGQDGNMNPLNDKGQFTQTERFLRGEQIVLKLVA